MMKIRYLALLLTIVSFGGTATTDISELEKKITTLGPKKPSPSYMPIMKKSGC